MKIAFTGHRPNRLGGFGPKARNTLQAFARRVLLPLDPDIIIVQGCALGWDTAVAKEAILQGHKVISCIPVLGFNSKWPLEDVWELEGILNKSHKVEIVTEGPYCPKAMNERNKFMVDMSDTLYALCADVPSGSLSCVTYAEKKSKSVNHLWSQWLKFKELQCA